MSAIALGAMAALSGAAATLNPIPQPEPGTIITQPLNTFRLLYENDSPFGRDQDYTHGTRLDYAHSFGTRHAMDLGWGVSLTQNMYTPITHTDHAVPGEHPYAGSLMLGGAWFIRSHQEEWTWGVLMELQVGVTGEPSLAHGVQHAVHAIGRMEYWKGWDDQVPSEFAIQLSQMLAVKVNPLSKSFGYWELDSQLFGRYDLGTLRISGEAGAGIRFGHNLPDYMTIYGNRSAQYGTGLVYKGEDAPDYDPRELSYFVTASVSGGYVARDFSIDGGVFHSFQHKTCSRTPWQAEARVGVGAVHRGIEYFMGAAWHSRTYDTQDRNSLYGTFSISLNW